MGKPYPGARRAHHPILNKTVLDKLRTFCAANNDAEGLMYQQIRATMAVANRHKKSTTKS